MSKPKQKPRGYILQEDKSTWLVLVRTETPPDLKFLKEYLIRDEDNSNNVVYAVLKDEIEAIYLACRDYLYGHKGKQEKPNVSLINER
jgi:hypothetical protein